MDSTPPELFHRYKGFGYVGILGDEESCEMKRKFLWVENMWGDFGEDYQISLAVGHRNLRSTPTICNIFDYMKKDAKVLAESDRGV